MFTLGGKRPEDFGLVVLRGTQHPMLPRTEDHIVSRPGQAGEWDFGGTVRRRDIRIPMEFIGLSSAAALQAKIREFAAHLVDKDGHPRDLVLEWDNEPNVFYTVRYSGRLQVTRIMEGGRFNLPLVAVQPWGYSTPKTEGETITEQGEAVSVVSNGTVGTPAAISIRNTGATPISNIRITRQVEVE